jgi:hypothetical protein
VLSHPPRVLHTGAVSLLITAASGYAAGAMHHASAQATRTVLAQKVDPAGAPGRTLGLSRVTIPAQSVAADRDRPPPPTPSSFMETTSRKRSLRLLHLR